LKCHRHGHRRLQWQQMRLEAANATRREEGAVVEGVEEDGVEV